MTKAYTALTKLDAAASDLIPADPRIEHQAPVSNGMPGYNAVAFAPDGIILQAGAPSGPLLEQGDLTASYTRPAHGTDNAAAPNGPETPAHQALTPTPSALV